MIVLKHNDAVYIARSCWGFRDPEAKRTGVPDTENLCMWHPGNKRGRLMALSSGGRFADVLRYERIFPSVLDQKHLVLESYDKIYAIADRFGLCDGSFLPSRMVFAENDRAFVLYGDGGNVEVEVIYVHSWSDEEVMALYDLKGVSDPYEFFREAFQTLEQTHKCAMFPLIVMNTQSNKAEVIER